MQEIKRKQEEDKIKAEKKAKKEAKKKEKEEKLKAIEDAKKKKGGVQLEGGELEEMEGGDPEE